MRIYTKENFFLRMEHESKSVFRNMRNMCGDAALLKEILQSFRLI